MLYVTLFIIYYFKLIIGSCTYNMSGYYDLCVVRLCLIHFLLKSKPSLNGMAQEPSS